GLDLASYKPMPTDALGWLPLDGLPGLDPDLKETAVPPGKPTEDMVKRWHDLNGGYALIRDYPPVSSGDRADEEVSFRNVFDQAIALQTWDGHGGSPTSSDPPSRLESLLVRLTGWPTDLLEPLLARQISRDGKTWPPRALVPDVTAVLNP